MKSNNNQNDFFEMVYEVVRLIPKGKVSTYGAIAKYLGTTKSSRMVGWAMNKAQHQTPTVPAHRVVNRNGVLTGKIHFNTVTAMQEVLSSEGITIINDKVQNFDVHFWNPIIELEIK